MKDVQSKIARQVESLQADAKVMLAELGIDLSGEKSDLSSLVADFRKTNPDFKTFVFNLDKATYDSRKKMSWNAHMLGAFARLKAENTYNHEIKPRVTEYRGRFDKQIKDVVERSKDLKEKILH